MFTHPNPFFLFIFPSVIQLLCCKVWFIGQIFFQCFLWVLHSFCHDFQLKIHQHLGGNASLSILTSNPEWFLLSKRSFLWLKSEISRKSCRARGSFYPWQWMPFVHSSGSENIGKYLIPKPLWAPKGALQTWEPTKKTPTLVLGSCSTKQIPPSQAILGFMDPAAQNL